MIFHEKETDNNELVARPAPGDLTVATATGAGVGGWSPDTPTPGTPMATPTPPPSDLLLLLRLEPLSFFFRPGIRARGVGMEEADGLSIFEKAPPDPDPTVPLPAPLGPLMTLLPPPPPPPPKPEEPCRENGKIYRISINCPITANRVSFRCFFLFFKLGRLYLKESLYGVPLYLDHTSKFTSFRIR